MRIAGLTVAGQLPAATGPPSSVSRQPPAVDQSTAVGDEPAAAGWRARRELSRAAAVTGGWRAVAGVVRAVAKRLEGDGRRTEAVGAELIVTPEGGRGGGATPPASAGDRLEATGVSHTACRLRLRVPTRVPRRRRTPASRLLDREEGLHPLHQHRRPASDPRQPVRVPVPGAPVDAGPALHHHPGVQPRAREPPVLLRPLPVPRVPEHRRERRAGVQRPRPPARRVQQLPRPAGVVPQLHEAQRGVGLRVDGPVEVAGRL